MSLLVVGTIAFDSVETPYDRRDEVLGGSATHFAYAASLEKLTSFLLTDLEVIARTPLVMILGKGRITFVSNLIYNRFSEIANYPSGSAISLVMLLLSLSLIYGVSRLLSRRWE